MSGEASVGQGEFQAAIKRATPLGWVSAVLISLSLGLPAWARSMTVQSSPGQPLGIP